MMWGTRYRDDRNRDKALVGVGDEAQGGQGKGMTRGTRNRDKALDDAGDEAQGTRHQAMSFGSSSSES